MHLLHVKILIAAWIPSKQKESVVVITIHSPQTESSESVSVNSDLFDVPPAARRTSYTMPTVSHPSTQCSAASSSRALIHQTQPHFNVTVNVTPGIHSIIITILCSHFGRPLQFSWSLTFSFICVVD